MGTLNRPAASVSGVALFAAAPDCAPTAFAVRKISVPTHLDVADRAAHPERSRSLSE